MPVSCKQKKKMRRGIKSALDLQMHFRKQRSISVDNKSSHTTIYLGFSRGGRDSYGKHGINLTVDDTQNY